MGMSRGIRYNKWERGWQVSLPECPLCGHWVKAIFQGYPGEKAHIKKIKHGTFEQDMQCPLVKKEGALPHNRFQHLVTDYERLESRMFGAKEIQRRRELAEERRLNPRENYSPQTVDPFTIHLPTPTKEGESA